MHFVPSMLAAFLEESGVSVCRSLRRVICSGEALPYELKERFRQRLATQLHNLYGPTEASVDVTYWDCASEMERPIVLVGEPPIRQSRLVRPCALKSRRGPIS